MPSPYEVALAASADIQRYVRETLDDEAEPLIVARLSAVWPTWHHWVLLDAKVPAALRARVLERLRDS